MTNKIIDEQQTLRTKIKYGFCFVGCFVFALVILQRNAGALSAGIVARVDGAIITERDVEKKAELLASNLPNFSAKDRDLRDFAIDLILIEKIQNRYLIAEKALEVTEADVSERKKALRAIWRKGSKLSKRDYEKQLAEHARQKLTWEGYVRRVSAFNNPITAQDMLGERNRIRLSVDEQRYRLEEIFLPQAILESGTRSLAQRIYSALRAGQSFSRLAKFTNSLSATPYLKKNTVNKVLYQSELPPAVANAIDDRKISADGILQPIFSPYGVHIYRVRPYREARRVTRYSFLQTVFLGSLLESSQGVALRSASNLCEKPQLITNRLRAYDLTVASDVPEKDIPIEILKLLSVLAENNSVGPLPFSEGLVVFFTLCGKENVLDRADSQKELLQRLQKKRTEDLSLSISESLRLAAGIDRGGDSFLTQ